MPSQRKPKLGELLTTRELDVLGCAADGLSTEQSAAKLDVGPQTIKFHRGNLMVKLGATSTAHAVGIGFRTGLLRDQSATPVDAGDLSGVAMRLDAVATAVSQLSAQVRRIADATTQTDNRIAPIEEPDAGSGAGDGAAGR